MLTLIANFFGTAVTAAVVSIAYFDIHPLEYKPEINKVDVSLLPVKSLKNQVVFYNNNETLKLSKADMRCLEHNIFYEAGIEDYAGKIAVAQVTYNRLKTKRWGNTICKVVYSPHQFSWTKQKNRQKPKGKLWKESKRAAAAFVDGLRLLNLHQSLYYHASWMKKKPRWAKHKVKVHEIGQHIFYKPKKI